MSDTERLDASTPPRRLTGAVAGRPLLAVVAAVLVAVLLYYPVGMIWLHRIDDDPGFGAGAALAGPGAIARAIRNYRGAVSGLGTPCPSRASLVVNHL